jgi:hypothetical protein
VALPGREGDAPRLQRRETEPCACHALFLVGAVAAVGAVAVFDVALAAQAGERQLGAAVPAVAGIELAVPGAKPAASSRKVNGGFAMLICLCLPM